MKITKMRSKLLQSLPRIVVYRRNLSSFLHSFRGYSSKIIPQQPATTAIADELNKQELPPKKRTDREVHLLGPKDYRAPLPGNVGLGNYYVNECINMQSRLNTPPSTSKECDKLFKELPDERYSEFLTQMEFAKEMAESANDPPPLSDILECVAQECPILVCKDLTDLFPNKDLLSQNLTVITFSQKTKHDMSSWSEDVGEERETLIDSFVTGALQVCDSLRESGYWADFIDPTSGLPYNERFTNSTLLETDERYRHFGFTIEDLGCCKVIRHHLWGTHVFVGSVFTNAPLGSEEIREILYEHS